MIALLLYVILAGQGVPPLPTETGTVTGVIRTSAGTPASGVRVTAMVQPENLASPSSAASFASLAETDENGRYRLANIPPGAYYITAGRVDLPTYFPGTLEMLKGMPVSITSASVLPNIDFVMDDASLRPTGPSLGSFSLLNTAGGVTMPVHVRMEGGGKQPVFSDGHSVMLRLTLDCALCAMAGRPSARSEMALSSSDINFPIPGSVPGAAYQVTVENIPQGYVVKSMIQDGVDLIYDRLRITAKNFTPVVSQVVPPGAQVTVTTAAPIGNVAMPMTPLEITLATIPLPFSAISGVSVKGRGTSAGPWYLSISGKPGILFEDGSFEFRNVAPGRHVILLLDSPGSPNRMLAASVVVGDTDVDDVLADNTRVLPAEIRFPAVTPLPGSIPLAWIHGHVVDDVSRDPVFGGIVTIAGKTKATFPIDSEGQFEIPRLLPGTYDLTIDGFQHASIHQNVIVGDEDVQFRVSAHANR